MRQEEENRPLRIYQCEDTQNGILTAVYEAGISGYGHKYIRIAPIREGETESFVLFAEYITVVTDPEHARIVLDKVQSGISRNALSMLCMRWRRMIRRRPIWCISLLHMVLPLAEG